MTDGRLQELLLIGFLVLMVSCIVLPPVLDYDWISLNRSAELPTPTVVAATKVTVWVFRKTGLYYCHDSALYGKVRPGEFMTQETAQARGYRPSGGQVCQ